MQLYCNCNILIGVLYHLNYNAYPLSLSYFETLNNPIILHSTWGVCTFHNYNLYPYTYYISTTYISSSSPLMNIPSKNIYNSSNNHNRVMYKSYNFDLASPSIDHSIKISCSLWYARGISIEVLLNICVSTFLRVIHLNVYIISTIRDIL